MKRKQRGVALLITMLVLVVVVILTAQLSSSTRTSAVLSTNFSGDLQNYYALRAGVNYAEMMLKVAKTQGQPQDTLNDTWAQPQDLSTTPLTVGNATVSFRVEDEERRLNVAKFTMQATKEGKKVTVVNPAVQQRMDRLASVLGITLADFGQRIIDYQSGAQDAKYVVNNPSTPLLSFGELMCVQGMTEQIMYGTGGKTPQEQGLQPWVTVWGSGQININTAPLEVLEAFDPAVTKDEGTKILNWLQSKKQDGTPNSFSSINQKMLENQVGLQEATAKALASDAKAGALGVAGTFFSVFLRATTGGFETRARVVLARSGQNVVIVFWDEDQRYTKQQTQ